MAETLTAARALRERVVWSLRRGKRKKKKRVRKKKRLSKRERERVRSMLFLFLFERIEEEEETKALLLFVDARLFEPCGPRQRDMRVAP